MWTLIRRPSDINFFRQAIFINLGKLCLPFFIFMHTIDNIRQNIIGIDKVVTLLDGTKRPFVFLDNGASTPSFRSVLAKVEELLEWYSAIHRGNGIKSIVSTNVYEEAHGIILDFVGADKNEKMAVLVKNTTEAVNKLSYRLGCMQNDVILISGMEHHSNDLPWRRFNHYDFIDVDEKGYLDLDDLTRKLEKYKGRVRLVTVTGASNMSGIINPYHEIARIAHSHGAKIMLDAAQLAPHRKIDMRPSADPSHIDFLVMSAHKMYAPYGSGVLICSKEMCQAGDPEFVGGGMAKMVTYKGFYANDAEKKEEAGSPNVVGAVAFASALRTLAAVGMDNVAAHEIKLTGYALKRLEEIPQVKLLIETDYENIHNRLGVLTFTTEGMDYKKVAAILCYEYGIGVRSGRFCAHPYASRLLKFSDEEIDNWFEQTCRGEGTDIPGAIRVSFGIYNTEEEVDYLISSLKAIFAGNYKGHYVKDEHGYDYRPENFSVDVSEYFSF